MDSANALRSRSSCCCRVFNCFRLVSHTNTQNSAFRCPKSKLVTFSNSKQNLPDSFELYRLARPRTRWYQLRGLPLVGSECVCPQCNSSFVITRGSAMPSAVDLPVCISRCQELTENANNDSGPPGQNVSNHYMYGKVPNATTTAVHTMLLAGFRPR